MNTENKQFILFILAEQSTLTNIYNVLFLLGLCEVISAEEQPKKKTPCFRGETYKLHEVLFN